MKRIFYCLFILVSLNSFAQINFEKGYYITQQGEKKEGFIKNIEWKNNPKSIEFRTDPKGKTTTYTLEDIAEFSVSEFNFKKFEVNIDRSSIITSKLSHDKNPVFKKETLLLQLLIEGDADLYTYKEKSLTRYFLLLNDNIEQLVYKKYIQNKSQVAKNNLFKQQLSQKLKCNSLQAKQFENLTYSKADMTGIVKDYNTCKNPDFVYNKKENKGSFQLSIRPGVTFNNFKILSDSYYADSEVVNFKSMPGFRIGAEVEYIFPINKNKWSLISEPTYNYISAETIDFRGDPSYLDYNSFELPLGLRHYLFLNDNSKIYLNASIIVVFQLDSTVRMFDGYDFEFESGTNFALSIGYKFKNKFAIEYQYKANEQLDFDRGTIHQTTNFNSMALILGYSLF